MSEPLMPCPFCGGGETRIEENRLNRAPMMSGKESPVISVEIRHWCPPQQGQPRRNHVVKVGRDMNSAIAAWNRRAGDDEVAKAHGYLARNVLQAIHPKCEPLPDLLGLCTQIDNMVTEIPRLRAELAAVLPLAIAQERERCARVADARHDANKADAQTASMTRPLNAPLLFNHQTRYDEAAHIAAAIRQEPGHE